MQILNKALVVSALTPRQREFIMGIQSVFKNARVSGIVTISGQIKRSIDEEIDLFGGDSAQIERIKKTIGIGTRYITDEKTTTYDLTREAVSKLMEMAHLKPGEIEGIVFVTQTPDYRMPGNSHLLHREFGFPKSCVAFDVSLGCSGYIYGLWLAFSILASSKCQKILLCVGDTLSKIVNKKDRACAPIFGDASSATLIEKTPEESPDRKSVV